MTAPYHERFADALRAALPEGFEIYADRNLVTATHRVEPGASPAQLIGWPSTPYRADKRSRVDPDHIRAWIKVATARLRRDMQHYTPEARAAAEALLTALDGREG